MSLSPLRLGAHPRDSTRSVAKKQGFSAEFLGASFGGGRPGSPSSSDKPLEAALEHGEPFGRKATQQCPCGYFTDPRRECRCTPSQIHRYISRISGLLIDRVDIHVDVLALRYKELAEEYSGETSAQVRHRVNEARKVQRDGFKGHRLFCNGAMTSRHIKEFCQLDGEGRDVLKMAINELGISAG